LSLRGPPKADLVQQRLDRAAGEAETCLVDESAIPDLLGRGGDDDLARQRDP
jgi:hypothetical protein